MEGQDCHFMAFHINSFMKIRFSGLYQTWSEMQQYETFPNFGLIFLRKGQQHFMLA